jgi:hypothetical protein
VVGCARVPSTMKSSNGAITRIPHLSRAVRTSGVGSTQNSSNPPENEKNLVAHNPISSFSTAAFLRGHGFGWKANFPGQPNANQLESSRICHLALATFYLALPIEHNTQTLG